MKFTFEGENADRFAREMQVKEPQLVSAAQKVFRDLVEDWTNKVRGNFSGNYTGENRTGRTPDGKLRNRGKLKSSVGGRVVGKGLNNLRAILRVGGKGAFYAEVQEEGTTISGKWMTIPVGAALTGAGRLKSAAKIVKTEEGWGTSGLGRTFIKNGVIFSSTTKGGGKRRKPLMLYVLTRSVNIPPRLGARYALDRIQPKAMGDLSRKFFRILKDSA